MEAAAIASRSGQLSTAGPFGASGADVEEAGSEAVGGGTQGGVQQTPGTANSINTAALQKEVTELRQQVQTPDARQEVHQLVMLRVLLACVVDLSQPCQFQWHAAHVTLVANI